jgi:subfamily B ATP-binding cassette protein MsbA
MQIDNIKRQSYYRLLGYAKPYALVLAIGIFAGILTGGFFGASFFWIKGFIQPFEKSQTALVQQSHAITEKHFDSKELINKAGNIKASDQLDSILSFADGIGIKTQDSQGKMTLLGLLIFVGSFVIVWFFKNIADYINNYCMRWVGTRVVTDMRNEVFSKLLDQSLVFYGKADVGQLISRCIEDTGQIQSAVSNSIADLTSCPFQVLSCAGFIILVSVQTNNFFLLIVMIFAALLVLLPIVIVGKKVRTVYKRAYQRIAEVMSRMHEVFTGIILVKAYHTEQFEYNSFQKVNTSYFRSLVKAMRAELLMSPFTEFLGVAAVAVFFVYSYITTIQLSDIVVLVVPAMLAYQPLRSLAKVNSNIQKCMAAADRYFDLIDTNTKIIEIENPKRIREFKEAIKLNNVSFAYGEGRSILNDINFTLKKGNVVAVVGETGSGKTTIANLIARFYDVSSGAVTIDGLDIRELKISDIRDLVGIVTQNTILFNDTIASNIAYGSPSTPREEIIKAAQQANAHNFIIGGNHAEGYDTVVGEKGFKLSGGEKQRIAIARAILKNPPILILDEATSALDTVTEKLVQDALNNLMKSRTVFAIAHRLSTIRHADTILVMDKGMIVESGSHEELLAKPDGRYKHLYDIQFSKNV